MKFSFSTHFFIISLVLIKNVLSTCYSYHNGDTYPSYNGSYCINILQWDVSDSTISTYAQRDTQALNNYTILYNNYYQLGLVNIDCLGMANYFFCAKAYPTCDSSTDQIDSMCSWLCELFSIRCGVDNEFYQGICQNGVQSSETCSFQNSVSISLLMLLSIILGALLL